MPRTSRRKPKQQEKRRHWVDDHGWTHVTKGTRQNGQKVGEMVWKTEGYGPARIPEGMTLQDAIENYQVFRRRFEESSCHAELSKFIEETLLKVASLEIESCVCTGFGSFVANPHPNCPALEAASLYQLAAFEAMLEILRRRYQIDKVYFQEPLFNALDEEMLQSKGYIVLRDPEIFNIMTRTTFMFAPCNEWQVICSAIDTAYPALFVGNNLPEYPSYCLPYTERSREQNDNILVPFLEGRTWIKMPDFDLHISAMNASIFWKPDPVDKNNSIKSSSSADITTK